MSVKSLATGNRSVSLLAGNTPEHHILLAETTVGAGGTASITFSNIDQSYQHLQVRAIIRRTTAGAPFLRLQFNATSSSSYAYHYLSGNGTAASSGASSGATFMIANTYYGGSSLYFGGTIIDVLDYANTTKNKTIRSIGGYDSNGAGAVDLTSGLFALTNAITSITFINDTNDFSQYSSFQLYGVK